MSDERRCAHCGGPMIRGQRALGYGESERKFSMRIYCSIHCQYAAQFDKARADKLRAVLERHGLAR